MYNKDLTTKIELIIKLLSSFHIIVIPTRCNNVR